MDEQDAIISFEKKLLLPYQYYYPNFHPLEDKQTKKKTEAFFLSLQQDTDRNAILYIHIPFCTSHCRFCDFDKTRNMTCMEDYVLKILQEIEFYSQYPYTKSLRITNVHLGGGTPTLLTVRQISVILDSIAERYDVKNAWYSIEASPDTVIGMDMLNFLCSGCFNRVSIGVQTFDSGLRKYCGIKSSLSDVDAALSQLRGLSLELSVDLLYGFPEMALDYDDEERLFRDVLKASQYGVDSLELNLLYPAALFSNKCGSMNIPSSSQIIATRRNITNVLSEKGYQQYSDFSFRKCDNNINFEKAYFGSGTDTPDCLAFGASSFGYLNETRYKNIGIASYMSMKNHMSLLHPLTEQERINRRIVGFSKQMQLSKAFFEDENIFQRYRSKIQYLLDCYMIIDQKTDYVLTNEGRDFTDNILFFMLSEKDQNYVLRNVPYYLFT